MVAFVVHVNCGESIRLFIAKKSISSLTSANLDYQQKNYDAFILVLDKKKDLTTYLFYLILIILESISTLM